MLLATVPHCWFGLNTVLFGSGGCRPSTGWPCHPATENTTQCHQLSLCWDSEHNTLPSAVIFLWLKSQHTAICCHMLWLKTQHTAILHYHVVTENTTQCHPPLPHYDWKHNTLPSSITTLWLKTQHNAIFHYHVMTLWLKTQDTAIILYNVVTEDCTRCQLLLPCCNEKRINKAELAAKVWKHLCRSIQKQILTRL